MSAREEKAAAGEETVESWEKIAELWGVTIRTAQRYAKRGAPVRKNARTRRVYGRRALLVTWKRVLDEGEPIGTTRPGRAA